MAGSFTKYASERYPVGVNMAGQVPVGMMLLQGVGQAIDLSDQTDATTAVLHGAGAHITGMIAELTVKAGEPGHRYRIELTLRDNANNVYVERLIMTVR